MTADHLVCANCAGRVSDGRCPVCRAHRARLQEQQGLFAALSPAALIALLAGLLAVAVICRQALA
jgi:RNA polymerase subunit RPABC4/transcription elongation factor Spt4